jgi:hypothetical protein
LENVIASYKDSFELKRLNNVEVNTFEKKKEYLKDMFNDVETNSENNIRHL